MRIIDISANQVAIEEVIDVIIQSFRHHEGLITDHVEEILLDSVKRVDLQFQQKKNFDTQTEKGSGQMLCSGGRDEMRSWLFS